MAEETLNKAISSGLLRNRKCVTRQLLLDHNDEIVSHERFCMYGKHASEIENIVKEKPLLGNLIDKRLPYTRAEILWICRNEMPVKLEDILARRTRALFLDVKASLDIASETAELMATEMGFDRKWIETQITEYKKLTINYL